MPSRDRDNPHYLVIDQGSHATRAALIDRHGEILRLGRRPVATRYLDADRVEQDAEELLASVTSTMADAISPGLSIVAAGLATQRSSIVCWDRDSGAALSPVLSWQDRRARVWLERLADHADSITRRSGLPPSAHYGAGKLRWCLDHIPAVRDALEAGRLVCGPLAGYLADGLVTGKNQFIDPANAGRTQLWNPQTRDWDEELLSLYGVPREILPQSVATLCRFGALATVPGNPPLSCVTGDQAAALFADGMPDTDTLYVNLGTGAFVQRVTGDTLARIPGLLSGIAFSDDTQTLYTLEGTVNGAGSALTWLSKSLSIDATDLLTRLPDWLQDVNDPALFLNGVAGLGAPFWIPTFESRFIGPDSTAARAVAVIESVVFLLTNIIDVMRPHLPPPRRLRLSGGLARLDGLCRRLAALSGIEVRRDEQPEATLVGTAALLAGCPDTWRRRQSDCFAAVHDAALARRYRDWQDALHAALPA
jgi:glycerol kinase